MRRYFCAWSIHYLNVAQIFNNYEYVRRRNWYINGCTSCRWCRCQISTVNNGDIYNANRDKMTSAANLKVGMTLTIPQ